MSDRNPFEIDKKHTSDNVLRTVGLQYRFGDSSDPIIIRSGPGEDFNPQTSSRSYSKSKTGKEASPTSVDPRSTSASANGSAKRKLGSRRRASAHVGPGPMPDPSPSPGRGPGPAPLLIADPRPASESSIGPGPAPSPAPASAISTVGSSSNAILSGREAGDAKQLIESEMVSPLVPINAWERSAISESPPIPEFDFDKMECSICLDDKNVSDQALTQCCDQIICCKCAETLIAAEKSCPHCRSSAFSIEDNKKFSRRHEVYKAHIQPLDHAKKKIEGLKRFIIQIRNARAKDLAKHQDLRDNLAKKIEELHSLEKTLKQKTSALDLALEKTASLQQDLQKKERIIQTATTSNEDLQREVDRLKHELASIKNLNEQEPARRKKEIQDTPRTRTSEDENSDDPSTLFERLGNKIKRLQTENTALKTHIASLENTLGKSSPAINQEKQRLIGQWVKEIHAWNKKIIQHLQKGVSATSFPQDTFFEIYSAEALKEEKEIQKIDLVHAVNPKITNSHQKIFYQASLRIFFKPLPIKATDAHKKPHEKFRENFRHLVQESRGPIRNVVEINLSLYGKKRLHQIFIQLVENYHIPKEIIDELWISQALYRRYTSQERTFYDKLKKWQDHPPSHRYSFEELECLTKQASEFDTKYLKDWLANHKSLPMGMQHFQEVDDQDVSLYSTISEAMFSLAEAYFQRNAFHCVLLVLERINKTDAFFPQAQLMRAKIDFSLCRVDHDIQGVQQRKNMIIRFFNELQHPAKIILTDRLMEIHYGYPIKEIEGKMRTHAITFDPIKEKQSAKKGAMGVFEVLDTLFPTRGPLEYPHSMREQMQTLFPERSYVLHASQPARDPLLAEKMSELELKMLNESSLTSSVPDLLFSAVSDRTQPSPCPAPAPSPAPASAHTPRPVPGPGTVTMFGPGPRSSSTPTSTPHSKSIPETFLNSGTIALNKIGVGDQKVWKQHYESALAWFSMLGEYGIEWKLRSETMTFQAFKKAAEHGLSDAQFRLANCYLQAFTVEQDLKTAADWFEKAAVLGDLYAQCRISSLYWTGTGVVKDIDKAVKWFKKALGPQWRWEDKARSKMIDIAYPGITAEQLYNELLKATHSFTKEQSKPQESLQPLKTLSPKKG